MIAKRIAAAVLLAGTATVSAQSSSNWNTHVERADGAHIIGNPQAEKVLTEFFSYTCPHCGTYARTGGEALKLAYVGPGRVRLEYRHYVRDPVDLTAAMLTWCGDKAKFPRNHAAFMHAQPQWLDKAGKTSVAQRQRWTSGPLPARFRAIAADLDFYAIMEGRGYGRTEIDRCLADTARANRLAENSQRDAAKYNVAGTPSFALDGTLLAGVHTWPVLEQVLRSEF